MFPLGKIFFLWFLGSQKGLTSHAGGGGDGLATLLPPSWKRAHRPAEGGVARRSGWFEACARTPPPCLVDGGRLAPRPGQVEGRQRTGPRPGGGERAHAREGPIAREWRGGAPAWERNRGYRGRKRPLWREGETRQPCSSCSPAAHGEGEAGRGKSHQAGEIKGGPLFI